ncbi:MAG: hypothetical protein HQL49_09895 [Gammaproteobacteria bacterium]|nr:hypothetical protein [Gammaproteobacteria bacterium]
MNKKVIALAVAGVLSAPLMVQAESTITLGGDARARAYSQTPDGGDTGGVADSRIRLKIEANDDKQAGINYRMKLSNTSHANNKPALDTDYAWAWVDTGVVKLSGGVMVATWGNGLVVNDARPNRLLATTTVSGFTLAAGYDVVREAGLGVDPEKGADGVAKAGADGDTDKLVLFARTKNFGLIYVNTMNNEMDTSNNIVDAFYNGKFGDVSVDVEVASKGGDSDTGTIFGGTVMVPVGGATLAGIVIQADDTGTLDGDYLADRGIMAFDQDHIGLGNMSASADESLTIVGGAAIFSMSDKVGAQLTLAQVMMSDSGADDMTLIDGHLSYKVGKASSVMPYFSSLSDVADGYGVNIETKF